MNNRKLMLSIVILVATIMVFSSALVIFASPAPVAAQGTNTTPATNTGNTVATTHAPQAQYAKTVNNLVKNSGKATKNLFLPNLNSKVAIQNDHVTPLYSQSPAPMGIGDLGIINQSGTLTGYTYNTSSFEGSVTINNLSDFYLLSDAPQSVTIQLNTVLNNVNLFGNSSYEFWTQNVFVYSARTHQVFFEDNIWNFSSPTAVMEPNTIYNSTGQIYPYAGVHIAIGPVFNVTYPFTVHMYLNTTNLNGRNVVYFNYSIPSIGQSGTYDRVTFNSTPASPSQPVAPAYFQVNGTAVNPTGFLLNDAEIMIGGPGGGSTAMIYSIDATMNLKYYDATTSTYQNVRSAYDIGTDTGETSSGVAMSWTPNAVAHLSAGPGFVYGMWNISSPSTTMTTYSGNVNPSNAFMFVTNGSSFNDNYAVWSPLGGSSHYSFTLPTGVYTAEALMSNYDPQTFTLGTDVATNLVHDYRMGIYTPLRAFNDAQVAGLAVYGHGTAASPYVIMNNGNANMMSTNFNELFGAFNDYVFPSFYGVLLMNTNVHVNFMYMPALKIQYTLPFSSLVTSYFGLPSSNYLNYEFYNTSNVAVMHSYVSGWFSFWQAGFNTASMEFWNSTHSSVLSNYFSVMDDGLMIYNDNWTVSNNLVWGNYFVQATGHKMIKYMGSFSTENFLGAPIGLFLFSSGNLIYNNYFNVELTAANLYFNIYTYEGSVYFNTWNVSTQPAYNVNFYNGFALYGSIINTKYQGGNYWYNYQKGQPLPYNNNGWIEFGGDYAPLVHVPYHGF